MHKGTQIKTSIQNEGPTASGIAPFLHPAGNRFSRLLSFAGLSIGVWLLLTSLQVGINVSQLLTEKNINKTGFDFLSVTKKITNENMGSEHSFTPAEISALKHLPTVEDVAPLISNQFRVRASAGDLIPFSTDLFIESVNDQFIDTLPSSFTWKPGQVDVPIIFSADFLEMYNVFAPAQDLPQLSESSIGAINIMLECYGPGGMQTFRGHIVAVSDRINTVLVPAPFLEWANMRFGATSVTPAARVYLKAKDANNPQLLNFLEEKDYRVNRDKTKFGRIKQTLQAVIGGLAVFAVLIIAMALMLFTFYLQLMISRSKENLQLLITLGYAPNWLGKKVSGKWIPVYAFVVGVALLMTQVMQSYFSHFTLNGRTHLSPIVHPMVLGLALLLFLLCIFLNKRMIRISLNKL